MAEHTMPPATSVSGWLRETKKSASHHVVGRRHWNRRPLDVRRRWWLRAAVAMLRRRDRLVDSLSTVPVCRLPLTTPPAPRGLGRITTHRRPQTKGKMISVTLWQLDKSKRDGSGYSGREFHFRLCCCYLTTSGKICACADSLLSSSNDWTSSMLCGRKGNRRQCKRPVALVLCHPINLPLQ